MEIKRKIKKIDLRILMIIGLLMPAIPGFTESDQNQQRIYVFGKTNHVLTPTVSLSYQQVDFMGSVVTTFHPAVSLGYRYQDKLMIGVSMPAAGRIIQTEKVSDIFDAYWGDPSLSLGWNWRLKDTRLKLKGMYSYPLGIWNEYQAREMIQSGKGFHTLGLDFSVSRIIDPVLIGAGIGYRMGLPRRERSGMRMQTGQIDIDLNMTEVLNDTVGYRVGLEQSIELPDWVNGKIEWVNVGYQAGVFFSVMVSLNDLELSAEIDKKVSELVSVPKISVDGSYQIEF